MFNVYTNINLFIGSFFAFTTKKNLRKPRYIITLLRLTFEGFFNTQ